ncbi:hypothetical protein QOT17_016564 [Balamuthia mandrillaris]
MVWLLPSLQTRSPQPFRQQEALGKQRERNDKEQKEEQKKGVKPMRNNHTTVKSLWHLSAEAVLGNKLLPPGLLTSVPNPPFTWLSSTLTAERTTNQQQGTKERKEEGEGSVEEVVKVVLPEDVKERMERLQRRCDVCAHLFLEVEEEKAEEGQALEAVRRYWDEERGVWWELLCCSQDCFHRPLPGCSQAIK